MAQTHFENTFICVILGNTPTEVDDLPKCRKYTNYSLFSNAIIITLLSQKHCIPDDHIIVFGYGTPDDYNITVMHRARNYQIKQRSLWLRSEALIGLELNLFDSYGTVYIINAIIPSPSHTNQACFFPIKYRRNVEKQ